MPGIMRFYWIPPSTIRQASPIAHAAKVYQEQDFSVKDLSALPREFASGANSLLLWGRGHFSWRRL